MIATIKRNWENIKRVMILSNSTNLGWKKYSMTISSGLSSNVYNHRGNGEIIYFVEHLIDYAMVSNEYLRVAIKLSDDQIRFVSERRVFLLTINF